MTNEVERHFICILAIWAPSCIKYWLKSLALNTF